MYSGSDKAYQSLYSALSKLFALKTVFIIAMTSTRTPIFDNEPCFLA